MHYFSSLLKCIALKPNQLADLKKGINLPLKSAYFDELCMEEESNTDFCL